MALCALAIGALGACSPSAPLPDVASGSPTDRTSPSGETELTTEPDADLDAGGPNRAVVEIGRQRYVADLTDELAICLTGGGGIAAAGMIDGFTDGYVTIELPPIDWETRGGGWDPPVIELDLGTDADGVPIELHAGGDDVAAVPELDGRSQVDTFVIDGNHASGTATFVDLGQLNSDAAATTAPVQLTGRFAIECG